jgi:hypothetical protein
MALGIRLYQIPMFRVLGGMWVWHGFLLLPLVIGTHYTECSRAGTHPGDD